MKLSLINVIRPTQSLLASQPSATVIGARLVTRGEPATQPVVAQPAARPVQQRSIEPMLAVYDARVETFRILANGIGRVWKALVDSLAARSPRVAAHRS